MLDQCTAALHQCRLFESSDLEETEDRIGKVMQPHRLHPAAPLGTLHRAHMDYLALPSIGVGVIEFGEMKLKLEQIRGYHLLIFSARGRAELRSGRDELTARAARGACLAPGDSLHAHFTADCEQFVIRIDAAAMRRHAGTQNPRLTFSLELGAGHVAPWINVIRAMLADPVTVKLIQQDRRVATDYENLFFSTLLASQALVNDTGRSGAAPATVKRAEDYIDAHFSEALTLPMIAEAAGVPVRTLLASFRRFRNTTPIQHLHQRRLHAARAALLRAGAHDSVLAIALDAGFSHLGRFAAAYSSRYGEKPSHTLHRAARYSS